MDDGLKQLKSPKHTQVPSGWVFPTDGGCCSRWFRVDIPFGSHQWINQWRWKNWMGSLLRNLKSQTLNQDLLDMSCCPKLWLRLFSKSQILKTEKAMWVMLFQTVVEHEIQMSLLVPTLTWPTELGVRYKWRWWTPLFNLNQVASVYVYVNVYAPVFLCVSSWKVSNADLLNYRSNSNPSHFLFIRCCHWQVSRLEHFRENDLAKHMHHLSQSSVVFMSSIAFCLSLIRLRARTCKGFCHLGCQGCPEPVQFIWASTHIEICKASIAHR